MSEKITKIIIITLLLLILGSAVGFVYYFLFGRTLEQTAPKADGSDAESRGIFPTAEQNQSAKPGTKTLMRNTDGTIAIDASGRDAPSKNAGITILNTRNITDKPATAPFFMTKQDTKTLFVRYMERGTGHIYELPVGQSELRKISDTTLTKTYETLWGQNGKTLIASRLDDAGLIENLYSYIEEAGTSSTTIGVAVGKITSTKISGNVKTLAVSPDHTKFFYLNKIDNDFVGYISDFSGKTLATRKTQTFSSPTGSWNISWPNSNIISFLTKPSANIHGSLHFLNLRTQGFEKILGEINGLMALVSPDAKKILYTASTKGSISTYVYNVATNESVILPIKTLVDKCIWSLSNSDLVYCAIPTSVLVGDYPDDWYQGIISFSDEIWKVDVKTSRTELIAGKNLFQSGGGVDVENLSLSPNEDYLAFTNKRDSTPWIIKTR